MAEAQLQGHGSTLVISIGDDCGGTWAVLAKISVSAVGVCFSNHRHGISVVRHRFPEILQGGAPDKASEASLRKMLDIASPANVLVVASCHPCFRSDGGYEDATSAKELRKAARDWLTQQPIRYTRCVFCVGL